MGHFRVHSWSPFGSFPGPKSDPKGIPEMPQNGTRSGPASSLYGTRNISATSETAVIHRLFGHPPIPVHPGGSKTGSKRGPKVTQNGAPFGSLLGPILGHFRVHFWSPFGSRSVPLLGHSRVQFWSPFGSLPGPLLGHFRVHFWSPFGSLPGPGSDPKGFWPGPRDLAPRVRIRAQTSDWELGPGGPPYPYLPLRFTKIMEFLKIGSAIADPN